MANATCMMIGKAGAACLNYFVADVDADKPSGVNTGDLCYCVDTNMLYEWTSADSWSPR